MRIEQTASGLPLLRLDGAFLIRGHRGAWSLDFIAAVGGATSQVTVRVGRRRGWTPSSPACINLVHRHPPSDGTGSSAVAPARRTPREPSPRAGQPGPEAARGYPAPSVNRLSPLRFVLGFGVVSMLADFVYEGACSVAGPYLATLGATAAMVGVITGSGEAVALVLRLFTGRLSDRTGRHWALSVSGYVITVVAVPLLGAAQALWQAGLLVIGDRFGKAVRTPARDTMLAQAGISLGRGWAFGVHEAMDQSGALLGPLLVALMVWISGYRLGFGVLAVPGALAVLALAWLRRAVPAPGLYEGTADAAAGGGSPPQAEGPIRGFTRRFWHYTAFTALSMAGFATFGVLSYHLEVHRIVPAAEIPVIYAAAMAAVVSGRAYDRLGLRVLVAAPVLAAIVAPLSFSSSVALVWIGGALWGAAMGRHESTLRAAVADLVPAVKRGTGYGTFTAVYGLAWLAGGSIIGILYGWSIQAAVWFAIALQGAAFVTFIPLLWGPHPAQGRRSGLR